MSSPLQSVTLLGVRIDNVNFQEACDRMHLWLSEEGGTHVVVTPNPEICVRARREASYRDILNSADLALPDGVGLLAIARLKRAQLRERVTGADLLPRIFEMCMRMEKSVGVVLPTKGLSSKENVVLMLQRDFPGLKAVVVCESESDYREQLRDASFIAVALGAPLQEQWIERARTVFPKARVLMGVGTAIDFLTGRAQRAPRLMRRLGLEWLWRLVSALFEGGDDVVPHKFIHRLKRIWTAVVVFPYLALTSRK